MELIYCAVSNQLHRAKLLLCPIIPVFAIAQTVLNNGMLLPVPEVQNVSTSQSYSQPINKLWLLQRVSIEL